MTMLLIFLRKKQPRHGGWVDPSRRVARYPFCPDGDHLFSNPLDVLHKLAPPSWRHWLGTDSFGRDVLTRVMYGGRYTLAIGIGVVAIAFTVGVFFGTLAGFSGGIVDMLIMRVVDAMLSFPALVLAIALAAAFGPSLNNAMLAVAITLAPQFARVARSQALASR